MTTSWNRTQAERYRQLAELWPRAAQLNGQEIEQLCVLILEILSQCSKANLASTGQEVEDLIHAYIEERVLRRLVTDPAKFASQMPTSHGALILFFQNFVISMARKSESQLARRADMLETDEGVVRAEVESNFCQIDLVDRLQAQGFSIDKLERDVKAFLAGVSNMERVLVHNYCDAELSMARLFPNSPQQQSLARVAVAQMGLWYGRTGNRDLAKFAQTRLGRFMMQQIGQPLNETHRETLQTLMSLICQLA